MALVVLTGLFDRVGLQTNVDKTVLMVCQSVYTRRIIGVVPYLWEWQQEIVWCPECELELAVGYLEEHQQAQHVKD